MAQLAVFLSDSSRTRLAAALLPDHARVAHQVTYVGDWVAMHTAAKTIRLHVALFDPYRGGGFDAEGCGEFHRCFPSVALLPYGRFAGHPPCDVLRLAELGVRRLVCRDENDATSALRAALAGAVGDAGAGRITAELAAVLAPAFGPLLHDLVCSTHAAPSPGAVARSQFCHEKTLRERLRGAGLPPTNKLIVWARLLHAACLLEDPGHTVEGVALALQFPSAAALQKQMLRYAGVGPREVAARGGLAFIGGEFRRSVRVRD
jgi:AraC-like DNA-binding protein